MPDAPPFDRAIALACSMLTLRARWLYVRCACGTSDARPIRLMLADGSLPGDSTLADVVVHLRCHSCRARPFTIHLSENGYGPGGVAGRTESGWCLHLHGGGE